MIKTVSFLVLVLGVLLQNSVSDAFLNRRTNFTGRAATKMTDKFSSALLDHPNNCHDEDKSRDESEIEGLANSPFFQFPIEQSFELIRFGWPLPGQVFFISDILMSSFTSEKMIYDFLMKDDGFIWLDFGDFSESSTREQFDKLHKFLGLLGPGRVHGLDFGRNDEVIDETLFEKFVLLDGNPTLENKTEFPPDTEMVLIGIDLDKDDNDDCKLHFHITPSWHGTNFVTVSLDYLNKCGNPVVTFNNRPENRYRFYRPQTWVIKNRGVQVLYY